MIAAEAVQRLASLGVTVGTAESLTGGLLCGQLTSVPGSSRVVLGGVVAYSDKVKVALLDVAQATLDRAGPVSADVALAMARGGVRRLGCDVCLSTTGEAGPQPASRERIGTVFIGCAGRGRWLVRGHSFSGDRESVRSDTCRAALELLATWLDGGGASDPPGPGSGPPGLGTT